VLLVVTAYFEQINDDDDDIVVVTYNCYGSLYVDGLCLCGPCLRLSMCL